MGGQSSVEKFLAAPLQPQRNFPFVVNQRFITQHTSTFVLDDNFWFKAGTEGYSIKDAYSGMEVFRVEPSVTGVEPKEGIKWLVDAYKIPIAHINEVHTYTTAYNVHVGKEEDYYLTQIEVKYIPLHNNACYAEYQNPETGEKSRIGIHGLWRQRRVFIYLDRGMTGGRQAIAKVSRPENKSCDFGKGQYHVEVVKGVDTAFILMVCAAMDDALQHDINADKKR